jgi:hypothetical protein
MTPYVGGGGINMKKRIVLIFLSVLLISIGYFNNEFQVVFNKAVNICLECIGIG